jgi:hypothetical protein
MWSRGEIPRHMPEQRKVIEQLSLNIVTHPCSLIHELLGTQMHGMIYPFILRT